MKQIKLTKPRLTWRIYLAGAIGVVAIAAGLTYSLLRSVNQWFATRELVFNKVINLELKRPVEIKEREVATQEVIRILETIPAPEDLETDIEHYIYEVFGIEHYRMAIATFKCESGLREDAIGINATSVDIGIAQINSSNFKIEGCSLKEVVDAKKNIDCAYKLWDRGNRIEGDKRGNFNAWVGFKNGCALTKYE